MYIYFDISFIIQPYKYGWTKEHNEYIIKTLRRLKYKCAMYYCTSFVAFILFYLLQAYIISNAIMYFYNDVGPVQGPRTTQDRCLQSKRQSIMQIC